jgi:hypothetical protein
MPEPVTITLPAQEPAAPRDAGLDPFTLEALADVCTQLGRAAYRSDVQHQLKLAAKALRATGLIVWLWDEIPEELRPTVTHGYSPSLLAHLPTVKRDADNATAAAFRSETACDVPATEHTSAALVVPLLTADGCSGVLAIEMEQGVELTRTVRAIATIVAAAVTQLVHRSKPAARPAAVEQPSLPAIQVRAPLRPVKVRR